MLVGRELNEMRLSFPVTRQPFPARPPTDGPGRHSSINSTLSPTSALRGQKLSLQRATCLLLFVRRGQWGVLPCIAEAAVSGTEARQNRQPNPKPTPSRPTPPATSR